MDRPTLIIGNRNYSSWSLRAWLALKATGMVFDEVVVPLGTPETEAAIRQHSPSVRVPAFRDGEILVWDSLAICEHLAETHPEAALWPADPVARAVARSVTAEMHSGFVAVRKHMHTLFDFDALDALDIGTPLTRHCVDRRRRVALEQVERNYA